MAAANAFQKWAYEICGVEPTDTRTLLDKFRDELIAAAVRDVGVMERSPNDSPEIRGWLADVGIHYPAPYCAAWISAKIVEASAAAGLVRLDGRDIFGKLPLEPSAGALRLAYDAEKLGAFIRHKGGGKPPALERGDLLIWKRPGASWQGHVGLAEVPLNGGADGAECIEANVPDQRGREGVVERFHHPEREPLFLGHVAWSRVPLLSGGKA